MPCVGARCARARCLWRVGLSQPHLHPRRGPRPEPPATTAALRPRRLRTWILVAIIEYQPRPPAIASVDAAPVSHMHGTSTASLGTSSLAAMSHHQRATSPAVSVTCAPLPALCTLDFSVALWSSSINLVYAALACCRCRAVQVALRSSPSNRRASFPLAQDLGPQLPAPRPRRQPSRQASRAASSRSRTTAAMSCDCCSPRRSRPIYN